MMPRIAPVMTLLMFSGAAVAQPAAGAGTRGAVSGLVAGADSTLLAQVRVQILELNRVTYSDDRGRYVLSEVPHGRYTLAFSRLGLAPSVRRLAVTGSVTLDVVLQPALLELAAVQAVATGTAGSVFASPQPTSVLEGSSLRASHGSSVGDALEGLPGVRSMSMSPGIGKPVIRGLSSNRVVVVDDGQRLETQQWGSDHGPNTETLGASRIEVLRGPASVLYGSDALGGVVNIVRPPPPDAIGIEPFLRIRGGSAYYSNPAGLETTVGAEAAAGVAGVRLSATQRGTRDVQAPRVALHNTGNDVTNLDVAGSVRVGRGSVTAGYVTRRERIEIYEDPRDVPDFTGYQRIFEQRGMLRATAALGADRFEALVTRERNERREFDDINAGEIALGLLATTNTGQLTYHQRPLGPLSGTAGLSYFESDFVKFGRETLIPSSATRNIAAFLFEQGELGPWLLSAGLRFDGRTLRAHADSVLQMGDERRSWGAVTGNAGVLYRVSEPVALVLNIGRGFRAPSAADLFSNGYHEGTRAFERGDPSLGVETSLNFDFAVRAQSSVLNAEAGLFANRIRDYIYLKPVGSLDTLLHAQGDALLTGVEAHVDYVPVSMLAVRATVDYTRGRNTTLGVPLTLIPPARATFRLQLQPSALGAARRPFASLTWEATAAQRRLHPGDVGTRGYGLAHAAAGATFARGSRVATVDVVARNLLDRSYRNFMSAYKTVADAPGRSVSVRVALQL
ncbi:MAG TPA: TonB-dependent receptor [Gemmatimonadaceae bacterium]|nr:TonB-dependent receptor [Gemmatimonadaceae bacterium]